MALTTVAELRTALGVGTLYADAVLQQVCDAADNVLLPFIWSNTLSIIGHSNTNPLVGLEPTHEGLDVVSVGKAGPIRRGVGQGDGFTE